MAENLQQSGLDLHSATGWRLLIDRDRIVLTRSGETVGTSDPVQIEENDLMVSLPDGARLILTPAMPADPFPNGRDSVIVDQEKLHFPLLLRHWRPGDVFQPFGMDGQHQKLQDFFTNLKLSRLEKERARVLENGDGKIIWIPGYRSDERFRVKTDTRNALKIAWIR
ncbi:MAG: tRNA lysidine(34) synthetase TilS [Lewinellaceae bacterium]|nr:tRNA lysidine(34) synthetase TilS [Lewinellaceae bacterium]